MADRRREPNHVLGEIALLANDYVAGSALRADDSVAQERSALNKDWRLIIDPQQETV